MWPRTGRVLSRKALARRVTRPQLELVPDPDASSPLVASVRLRPAKTVKRASASAGAALDAWYFATSRCQPAMPVPRVSAAGWSRTSRVSSEAVLALRSRTRGLGTFEPRAVSSRDERAVVGTRPSRPRLGGAGGHPGSRFAPEGGHGEPQMIERTSARSDWRCLSELAWRSSREVGMGPTNH
jgi:hypothetical protein